LEQLLIKHLNRNYYYLDGKLCKTSDGTSINFHYLIFILNTIFSISYEEIIITVNEWFFKKYRVDSRSFWWSTEYNNKSDMIMGVDVATPFEPRITMLARYGSNVINEDYYEVIRITG
jgi:hypothetical protein